MVRGVLAVLTPMDAADFWSAVIVVVVCWLGCSLLPAIVALVQYGVTEPFRENKEKDDDEDLGSRLHGHG